MLAKLSWSSCLRQRGGKLLLLLANTELITNLAQIALQTYFHGPLLMRPPNPPYPIFSRQHGTTSLEAGQRNLQNQPSFLRDTYTMVG